MLKPLWWLLLAALVIVVDQASKAAVIAHLQLHESVSLTSFFNLVLVFNYGASFSFLANAGGWQHWLFVGLALCVSAALVYMLFQQAHDHLLALALSLVLGGAVGNLIDRLRYGGVADFLDFHWAGVHFPAFNVADSAITAGVALLLLQQLFFATKSEPSAKS
jgi:signal peptidase II